MNIVAEFKITESFTITGRGLVILGDILSGTVDYGDVLTFNHNSEKHHLNIADINFAKKKMRFPIQ